MVVITETNELYICEEFRMFGRIYTNSVVERRVVVGASGEIGGGEGGVRATQDMGCQNAPPLEGLGLERHRGPSMN